MPRRIAGLVVKPTVRATPAFEGKRHAEETETQNKTKQRSPCGLLLEPKDHIRRATIYPDYYTRKS